MLPGQVVVHCKMLGWYITGIQYGVCEISSGIGLSLIIVAKRVPDSDTILRFIENLKKIMLSLTLLIMFYVFFLEKRESVTINVMKGAIRTITLNEQ